MAAVDTHDGDVLVYPRQVAADLFAAKMMLCLLTITLTTNVLIGPRNNILPTSGTASMLVTAYTEQVVSLIVNHESPAFHT